MREFEWFAAMTEISCIFGKLVAKNGDKVVFWMNADCDPNTK